MMVKLVEFYHIGVLIFNHVIYIYRERERERNQCKLLLHTVAIGICTVNTYIRTHIL